MMIGALPSLAVEVRESGDGVVVVLRVGMGGRRWRRSVRTSSGEGSRCFELLTPSVMAAELAAELGRWLVVT